MLQGSGSARRWPRRRSSASPDGAPLGVDEAIRLSGQVLAMQSSAGHNGPILVLVDSDSQRMSKRDELLGLNEYLAHLAKCLIYADMQGRTTVGLLYGHTAAGAFIATALATRILVALPGAEPAGDGSAVDVQGDKAPIDVLKERAKSTPVFAPGLDNLAQTGAVLTIWDEKTSLAEQLQSAAWKHQGAGRSAGPPRRSTGRASEGGRHRGARA